MSRLVCAFVALAISGFSQDFVLERRPTIFYDGAVYEARMESKVKQTFQPQQSSVFGAKFTVSLAESYDDVILYDIKVVEAYVEVGGQRNPAPANMLPSGSVCVSSDGLPCRIFVGKYLRKMLSQAPLGDSDGRTGRLGRLIQTTRQRFFTEALVFLVEEGFAYLVENSPRQEPKIPLGIPLSIGWSSGEGHTTPLWTVRKFHRLEKVEDGLATFTSMAKNDSGPILGALFSFRQDVDGKLDVTSNGEIWRAECIIDQETHIRAGKKPFDQVIHQVMTIQRAPAE